MTTTVLNKITVLMTLMTSLVAGAHDAGQHPDTLKVIKNVSSVVITHCDSTTRISVNGTETDPDYQFSYEVNVDGGSDNAKTQDSSRKSRWMPGVPKVNAHTGANDKKNAKFEYIYLRDICIGSLIPLNAPTGIDPSIDYSINYMAGMAYAPWRHGPEFSIGAGMIWRSLSIHNGMMAAKSADALVMVNRPAEYNSVKSSIYSFGFTIPVMITQRIVKDFGLSVGAVVNLNTYTTASTEYKIGDIRYKEDYKNLQQQILTVDLMAKIGLVQSDDLGLYVKYSPMHMFRHGYGPEFTMMSVGVAFGL